MTIGRRRGPAAALLVVAVVGLSACSDDPEPTFAPPSSSPSATESASGPVKEPWERKTDAGAVAFAKHWMATFSEAMNSGDTTPLLALSAADCQICADFATRLDSINSAGGFYEGDGWTVTEAVPAPNPGEDAAIVALRIREGAERVRESADAEVVEHESAMSSWSAHLEWTNGEWRMADLELVT